MDPTKVEIMQSDNNEEPDIPIGDDVAVEGGEIGVFAVVAVVVFDDVPFVVPVGVGRDPVPAVIVFAMEAPRDVELGVMFDEPTEAYSALKILGATPGVNCTRWKAFVERQKRFYGLRREPATHEASDLLPVKDFSLTPAQKVQYL
jgi:hypothetical protein